MKKIVKVSLAVLFGSSMLMANLDQSKNYFLKNENIMRLGYKCLKKADTLKEANQCGHEMDEKTGHTDKPYDDWSPKTKEEKLSEFEQYLSVMIPCVKKAETMQELQLCYSE